MNVKKLLEVIENLFIWGEIRLLGKEKRVSKQLLWGNLLPSDYPIAFLTANIPTNFQDFFFFQKKLRNKTTKNWKKNSNYLITQRKIEFSIAWTIDEIIDSIQKTKKYFKTIQKKNLSRGC